MRRTWFEVFLVLLLGPLLVGCAEPPSERNASGSGAGPDPLNATYRIEGEDVALVEGLAERPAAPGSAILVRTSVVGDRVQGDLDADGDEDAVMWLSQDPGGSGTFYYVAAAVNESSAYRGTTAVRLGDRIEIGALVVVDGIVRVDYLDRAVDAPMASRPDVESVAYLALGPDGLEPVQPDPRAAVRKADRIVVYAPRTGAEIQSPLTVEGRARGGWYFEGDFPLLLLDASGTQVAAGYASAAGEWMVPDFVPFEGRIEFEPPAGAGSGTLVFRKDNPSDQRELDDALEVPIRFSSEAP